jgi:uncharacterized protein (TIGR00369 family)
MTEPHRPDRAAILSMSGLDYLAAMLAGRVPPASIAATLNFALHAAEHGRVAFRGTPLASHGNPFGATHGGWYGAILDSALGCAVMSVLPRGQIYTTLEYKVNLTRALPFGMPAEAVATVQHAGRSTCVAAAELRGVEDGRLYATGSTTCLVMAG